MTMMLSTLSLLLSNPGPNVRAAVERQSGANRVQQCMTLIGSLPEFRDRKAVTADEKERLHSDIWKAACELNRKLGPTLAPRGVVRPKFQRGINLAGFRGRNRREQAHALLSQSPDYPEFRGMSLERQHEELTRFLNEQDGIIEDVHVSLSSVVDIDKEFPLDDSRVPTGNQTVYPGAPGWSPQRNQIDISAITACIPELGDCRGKSNELLCKAIAFLRSTDHGFAALPWSSQVSTAAAKIRSGELVGQAAGLI